jgi:hypothetical protein
MSMTQFRFLAIVIILLVAMAAPAQQTASGTGGKGKEDHSRHYAQDDLPKVETQLKILTEKLDLNGDQQSRIRRILQELHDATVKLVQGENLSQEERLAKVRPQRYKADQQIRDILSEDQKKKLDRYEQGPHPEMHGNLSGATSPPGAEEKDAK